MKQLIYIAVFATLLGVSGFVMGARSTRPDLTLTAEEELSLLRAEVSLQAAKNTASAEKDPAKAKVLADASEEKRKTDLAIAEAIRKSHRCGTCLFHWYLETDGSIRLETQSPTQTLKQ